MTCEDCAGAEERGPVLMVAADLGEGAFLAVLCGTCWHRRQYRAELMQRRVEWLSTHQAALTAPGA